MPRRALIVGLGLIGGSAGIALRRKGWRVGYSDPNVSLEEARAAGAADEESLAEPDVVLIATPVDVALEAAKDWASRAVSDSSPVLTSACSVMQPLRALALTSFIAGHPLAGSHERGLGAARADLFEGRSWFLDAEDSRVDEMVLDCGAVIERVSAEEHDGAMAITSHLPQILSTALAASLHGRDDLLRFAGSGLRTFLRLAGSDASVWAPVIEANRDHLMTAEHRVAELVRAIIAGDSSDAFARAQAVWRALEEKPH